MSLRGPHCTNLDRHCCICGNLLGKKTMAKEKYIIQLKSVLSTSITKDLQYYIIQRYAWNAVFLWIRSLREIYSTTFHLKHMKSGIPMTNIRTVRVEGIAKLK